MNDTRPDPDALLAEVVQQEAASHRGKLKVFFGSNAGVGKTYAMLDEARKRAAEGIDVVIGYAEAHIRPETESLLLGLDLLPYKLIEYKGATLKEFDLDAALVRKPAIVCVDELAHTNAPGLRHAKRWQDVYELLDAGINVYSTLNVQHLESVNDIVEHITGVRVNETLPDKVFDEADEVELIDISPDELIERLREGKVYKTQQAEQALRHFFNRGNLIALRELALRRTAERVDAQMRDFRRVHDIAKPWAANERVLVCVGPSPFAAQLIRATKRLASAFRAQWLAVSIETPIAAALSSDARERLAQNLRLAEQLGAQTVTLTGTNVVDELLAFARQRNITKIVIGKPDRPRWRDWLSGSIVDDLIRRSGQIDIYVVRHEQKASTNTAQNPAPPRRIHWAEYGCATLICAVATALGMFMYHVLGHEGESFSNTNVLMIDLLAVLFVAARFDRGPAIFASLFTVAAFDFTVVPPYYTFNVSDSQYLLTFAVMLVTALVISTLTHSIRRQREAARNRERSTAALLSLSRELAATREKKNIALIIARHVAEVFDSQAILFLPTLERELAIAAASGELPPLDDKELSVIRWVFDHNQPAGCGTTTLPAARGIYLPLAASSGNVGVLGLLDPRRSADPEILHQLEAFANQSALAVERAALAEESARAWERVEAEFLRNTLLSGVSHDLRTPLAAITGAASSLAETDSLSPAAGKELAENIVHEAERMELLITNLLDMTRLEAGGFQLHKEWHALPEIVGSAIHHLHKRLSQHRIVAHLPANLPLVFLDGLAMEQVFTNLLDNAGIYTPPGTEIAISAFITSDRLTIDVTDHGPGLPSTDPARVFQKFFRGGSRPDTHARRGMGLGLSICKGIVELHGGTITASNRPEGGAIFRITLPREGTPPTIDTQG